MPSWGELLGAIQQEAQETGAVNFDRLRLEALQRLHALTGRSIVSYSAAFLTRNSPVLSINLTDMQGLMEVFRGLPGPDLDLILHSPGGQAEATDRLVRYVRSRFDNVRVFVPLAAMSAATMWAMSADEIVMGKHSQLGPIDPQVTLNSGMPVPAGALVEQFNDAVDECSKDPSRVAGWLPTLQQYPPGLLNVCQSAAALSRDLVAEWLRANMLKDEPMVADQVADWLADDKTHLSHSRAITRDQLRAHGLPMVTDLESDRDIQDAVLTIHHLNMHTFEMTGALKIIENHLGRRYVITGQLVQVQPPNQP